MSLLISGGRVVSQILRALPLIFAASLGAADGPDRSWENLRQLRAGQNIEVVDSKMKSHRGRFGGFTDEAISLETDRGGTRIVRADVVRVSSRERSKRLRNILIGTVAGGGAGAVAMWLSVRHSQPISQFRGEYYDIAKVIFIPAGLGAGAGLGAAFPGFQTVYRARPQKAAPGVAPTRKDEGGQQ